MLVMRGLGLLIQQPVNGRVSSPFGMRNAPTEGASTNHKGMDYAVPVGTPVSAAAGGTVSFSGVQSGFGNVVKINHGGGYVSTYAHLSQALVKQGDAVQAGQLIALSGATGTVTGPNLHFQVDLNGTPTDPASLFGGGIPPVSGVEPTLLPDAGLFDFGTVELGGLQVPIAGLALGALAIVVVIYLARR